MHSSTIAQQPRIAAILEEELHTADLISTSGASSPSPSVAVSSSSFSSCSSMIFTPPRIRTSSRQNSMDFHYHRRNSSSSPAASQASSRVSSPLVSPNTSPRARIRLTPSSSRRRLLGCMPRSSRGNSSFFESPYSSPKSSPFHSPCVSPCNRYKRYMTPMKIDKINKNIAKAIRNRELGNRKRVSSFKCPMSNYFSGSASSSSSSSLSSSTSSSSSLSINALDNYADKLLTDLHPNIRFERCFANHETEENTSGMNIAIKSKWELHRRVSTMAMDINTTGSLLASGHGDHTVRLWSMSSLSATPSYVFHGHPRTACALKFDNSNTHILASGCLGGMVNVWDTITGVCIARYKFPGNDRIAGLSFCPNAHRPLLAIAHKSTIYFWFYMDAAANKSMPIQDVSRMGFSLPVSSVLSLPQPSSTASTSTSTSSTITGRERSPSQAMASLSVSPSNSSQQQPQPPQQAIPIPVLTVSTGTYQYVHFSPYQSILLTGHTCPVPPPAPDRMEANMPTNGSSTKTLRIYKVTWSQERSSTTPSSDDSSSSSSSSSSSTSTSSNTSESSCSASVELYEAKSIDHVLFYNEAGIAVSQDKLAVLKLHTDSENNDPIYRPRLVVLSLNCQHDNNNQEGGDGGESELGKVLLKAPIHDIWDVTCIRFNMSENQLIVGYQISKRRQNRASIRRLRDETYTPALIVQSIHSLTNQLQILHLHTSTSVGSGLNSLIVHPDSTIGILHGTTCGDIRVLTPMTVLQSYKEMNDSSHSKSVKVCESVPGSTLTSSVSTPVSVVHEPRAPVASTNVPSPNMDEMDQDVYVELPRTRRRLEPPQPLQRMEAYLSP